MRVYFGLFSVVVEEFEGRFSIYVKFEIFYFIVFGIQVYFVIIFIIIQFNYFFFLIKLF